MAQRFCARCNSEVEDAGGYCLLGHDLRLEPPVDSLRALRAEVNRTFDEARRELADVMAPATAFAPEVHENTPPAGSTAPTTWSGRLDEALVLEGPIDAREWADPPSPEAVALDDPEPAHAVGEGSPATGGVWEGLDEAEVLKPGDPIASFAPSPRMDWGPRKSRLLGRRSRADGLPADA